MRGEGFENEDTKNPVLGDNLVRIGLIYSSNESTVWPAGWTSLPTAELALEKITESGILPGNVELEIVLINSGCNKANARNMVLDRVRDGDIGMALFHYFEFLKCRIFTRQLEDSGGGGAFYSSISGKFSYKNKSREKFYSFKLKSF